VTAFNVLITINHDILIALLVIILGVTSFSFWILVQFYRFRSAGVSNEKRMLALPLPNDTELPHVLVQIPSFNEGQLINRIASAIANLDWPKNRLHAQILDDSTDEHALFVVHAIQGLCEQGIDAIRIPRRTFCRKASALSAGLQRSDQEFICIFDVDDLPGPKFLRHCIGPLLREPKLAFVEARSVALNGHENALTRAQQREQASHYAVELAALCWSGHLVRYNGSCAIWRRSAIKDAGGWSDDTLCEDLDLSYQAYLRGWKGLFLSSITVPGELPANFRDYRRQQFRWTKAVAEVALKVFPRLWRSRIPLGDKAIATLLFCPALYGPLTVAFILTGAVELGFGFGLTWPVGLLVGLCVLIGISSSILMMRFGEQQTHNDARPYELPQLILANLLLILTFFANSGALFEACFKRRSEITRTPKTGTDATINDVYAKGDQSSTKTFVESACPGRLPADAQQR
jgi:cellulose synthase/poly-beta-1,6-N-acetylglucosamine synthase-like glycosyltransferase